MPGTDELDELDAVIDGAAAAILVEGESDRRALQALAGRRGIDLAAHRTAVVVIGGAGGTGRAAAALGPSGAGLRLAGLYDVDEARVVARGLERAGVGAALDRGAMEAIGFFACDRDLEDELIRALGTEAVEEIVHEAGERERFRTFQQQPAQRTVPLDRQLRRFLGTLSGRKVRYGTLLVDALDLHRTPRPLDAVLAHATQPT